MADTKINDIQNILSEVDTILRDRLATIGVKIAHVMLALTPDGAGIIRSNVGPESLKEMAELLVDAADQADERRPDNEPLN